MFPRGRRKLLVTWRFTWLVIQLQKQLWSVTTIFLGFTTIPFYSVTSLPKKVSMFVLPDFFRRKAWPLENFPPENFDDLKKWAFVENSWGNKIKKDSLFVLEHLKKVCDVKKTGIFGFCWGGRILFDALMDENPVFQCGAALHPSGLAEDDFKNIKLPVILIISKEEAGLLPFESHLNSQHSSS
ncbi:hypothetical protein DSO57_1000755 [Entomophthora muscae]|uniref:Uncharacterized protein n=1 Tax=Entomophthora muscae TaxID=34485 RepID=A0ACC2T8U2_9FUNG|nr:hypothetical protein DSO57_1000755 [Entomophthora muscae]